MTQAISGLPSGQYSLSAMLRGSSKVSLTLAASTSDDSQQTNFTGTGTTATGSLPMGWQRVTLPAINVRKGDELTISLTATGSSWWSADNFQLTFEPEDPTAIDAPPVFKESYKQWIYDLSGRKVHSSFGYYRLPNGLKKGIYIVNGRKLLR
jgi:hypothetical protein